MERVVYGVWGGVRVGGLTGGGLAGVVGRGWVVRNLLLSHKVTTLRHKDVTSNTRYALSRYLPHDTSVYITLQNNTLSQKRRLNLVLSRRLICTSDGAFAWCYYPLEPVYIERQHQRCDNSAMMAMILFSLKTMESLENGLQSHSGATSLFSIRTVSLAS